MTYTANQLCEYFETLKRNKQLQKLYNNYQENAIYVIALFRSTVDNCQIQNYDLKNTLLQLLLKGNYLNKLESFLDGTSVTSSWLYS